MWNKDWVINIKTTHFEITPEVRNYVDEKLDTIANLVVVRDQDTEIKCDIELEMTKEQQSGDVWRSEMNLSVDGEKIRAESRGETIFAALDELKDEVTKILRRNKKKKFNMIRRSGSKMKDWIRFGRK
jgi:ribosomal subunit interface protein